MRRLYSFAIPALAIMICLVYGASAAIAAPDALSDALKQTERATKGLKGLKATASVVHVEGGEETRSSDGNVYISMQGKMRFEVKGDKPITMLCTSQDLYVYDDVEKTVTHFALGKDFGQLAQYALLGFSPSGNALKQEFLVTMIGEVTLGDDQVVAMELTPKKEKVRAEISKIELWIDQSNWLPIQQRIHHSAADTHLTIHYKNVVRDDTMKDALFKPSWPKGTKKVKG